MKNSHSKTKLPRPLGGSPPAEVGLPAAPLERVIAQVKFPVILKIESKPAVAVFQEEVGREYPVLREARNQSVMIQMGPSGPMAVNSATPIWQFCSVDDRWKLSLARDALTLETSAYQSRKNLHERWDFALGALGKTFHPATTERLGVRYIDRMSGDQFKNFEALVKPELLGTALAKLKVGIKHSLSETSFTVEEGEMLLRWGIMPPFMSPDPGAISPIPNESFVLDIDVWSAGHKPFDLSSLSKAFEKLAARAYSVFRFAVTDEFLKSYGGQL